MKACLPLLLAGAVIAGAAPAYAQIAVAAFDGKQLRPDDDVPGITPDEIAVIDLNSYPPKVLKTLQAPASMTGPPGAVAVAPDESFAIVTQSQKVDPADPTKLVFSDTVTVVDLRSPANARVLQTVQAGAGASGVCINRQGTLALVANSSADTVTVFAIRNRMLTRLGDIRFPAGAGPTDACFTPDGTKALAIRRGDHKVSVLRVQGASVTDSGVEFTPGRGPYGVAISPDGNFAYFNNLQGAATRAEIDATPPRQPGAGGGGGGRPGTISVVDLRTNAVVNSVEVGATPETVVLSPDGKTMAVVVANGASVQKLAPNYGTVFGLLRVFAVDGPKLTPMAEIRNGHWCQGATFSNDGRTLLVQCGTERNIEVYRIADNQVRRDEAATIRTRSRGGSMATARSR